MPRICTVCAHPEKPAIDALMVKDEPNRRIAARFQLSEAAVRRHRSDHLPATLAEAKDAEAVAHGTNVLEGLKEAIGRVQMLSDACDTWLRDADDPTRYDIGPRAEEIAVTYLEPIGDKLVKRKARLSELLSLALEGRSVMLVETRYADPRELILKSYDRLQGQLELIAKLIGQLDERPVVNLLIAPEWLSVRRVLVETLQPYPEAKAAVAARLVALERGA